MNAKLFLLSILLFLISVQIFGQLITKSGDIGTLVSESSTGNNVTGIMAGNTNAGDFYKSAGEIKEELRLELSCDANSYSDEALLIFNNTDPNEGAPKLYSMYATAPELWSVKNGVNYSINFLGELYSANVVALTVKAGAAGNYTLASSQVESFGSNSEISLEDRESGSFINLGTISSYTFHVSEANTISDRFYLHFLNVTSVPDPQVGQCFSIYSTDGSIIITSMQSLSGKIAVIDMRGRTVAKGIVGAGSTTRINVQGNTGVYIVSVLTAKGRSNTKVIVK